MKNLHELFVPYELALKLKEKGFDLECFGHYEYKSKQFIINFNNKPLNKEESKRPSLYTISHKNSALPQWAISAPTYFQIIDWYRIEHNLVLDVFQEFNGVDAYTGFWEVDVSELKDYKQPHKLVIEEVFEDYYEALNKAIEEALKII